MMKIENGHRAPSVAMACESVLTRSGCAKAKASNSAKNAMAPRTPRIGEVFHLVTSIVVAMMDFSNLIA